MNKLYPGIALIGNEQIAGIYGVNGGIVDAKGTGVQHLFYKDYEKDLIHSACTMIKIDNTLYYGNRQHTKDTHPIHLRPLESYSQEGFKFNDKFIIEKGKITKEDSIFAYGKNTIIFETKVTNNSKEICDMELYAYAICRNTNTLKSKYHKETQSYIIENENRFLGFKTEKPQLIKFVEESPTGFPYRTCQALFYNEKHDETLLTNSMAGVLCGEKVSLLGNESYIFKWCLVISDKEEELIDELNKINLRVCYIKALEYWDNWLGEGKKTNKKAEAEYFGAINLIAAKAVCLNGFIPADLTGHYYTNGSPCYYARDSMMVARAFLISGHYREFEQIMVYLIERCVKENGEFYQRYNGLGQPSEGANNNVFHQLDSIGYFAWNVGQYYKKTKKMLLEYEKFKKYIDVLLDNKRKKGMLGPEGGVNEGVFGPAFITSSNMYIYGGLKAAIKLAKQFKDVESADKWTKLLNEIYHGIQTTLINYYENNEIVGKRYCYGYIDYNDELVKKYDTPQYFGALYGYEIDEGMIETNKYYLKYSSFFEDGIGYSEQEYHHGPWIFNTAACAEYQYLTGNIVEYNKKIKWLINHSNSYGHMPEAIDANDENKCFINPLTWACAECAAAVYISKS